MRKSLTFAPVLIAGALIAGGKAQAANLPAPTASYDADITSDIGKNHTDGKINAIGPKMRLLLAMPNGQQTLFLEWDTSKAYLLVPQMGAALSLDPKMMGGYDLNELSHLPVTPDGEEAVSGARTTRYAVAAEDKHGRFDGHIWATAGGAILRIKGDVTANAKTTPVDIELSNFREERQNPAMVILPPSMKTMPLNLGAMGLQGKAAK